MVRMMNGYLMLILLICILSWASFASVNELKFANKGCCDKGTCGDSQVDRAVWYTTLSVGVLTTLFLLYHLAHDIMDAHHYIKSKLPPAKIAPAAPAGAAPSTQSLFGY